MSVTTSTEVSTAPTARAIVAKWREHGHTESIAVINFDPGIFDRNSPEVAYLGLENYFDLAGTAKPLLVLIQADTVAKLEESIAGHLSRCEEAGLFCLAMFILLSTTP